MSTVARSVKVDYPDVAESPHLLSAFSDATPPIQSMRAGLGPTDYE